MGGQPDVAVPDGGLLKVAHALFQRGAVGALDDLDIQADGGDFQGTQGAVAVVAVLGDAGEAHGGRVIGPGGDSELLRGSGRAGGTAVQDGRAGQEPAHAAGHTIFRIRVICAAHLIHQSAAQSAGDKVRREGLSAAGKVTGRGTEAGGHQGHVFAPVHVGVFNFIDGIVAGGPGEQEIVRSIVAVLQCAGLDGAQDADHAGQQEQSELFQWHYLLLIFLYTKAPPRASTRTAPPIMSGRLIPEASTGSPP